MATSALVLLQAILEKLRVYSAGQPINAADSARGLEQLNRMLDRWSNQSLTCFANVEQPIPLVALKGQYTIGTSGGADVNLTRPLAIKTGYGGAYLVDSNQYRYPVEVVEQDRWNQIGTLTINAQIPSAIFYDPQFPLGIVNVYPLPLLAYTLYIDSRLPFTQFASLTSSVTLPPGYEAAIENNGCVELKPFFKGAQLDPDIKELARESLADIKRTNMRDIVAQFDDAIVSHAAPTYNIYNDNGAQ